MDVDEARGALIHAGEDLAPAIVIVLNRLAQLETQLAAALALHRDVGPGMGHTSDGYGDFDHTCGSCGTSDEYAVAWPCPTARALGVES